MTEIPLGKSLTRLVATEIRRRPLAIRLFPGYMEIWRKGTRAKFHVSHEAIYNLAARIAAERLRQERQEARKARAQARRTA